MGMALTTSSLRLVTPNSVHFCLHLGALIFCMGVKTDLGKMTAQVGWS